MTLRLARVLMLRLVLRLIRVCAASQVCATCFDLSVSLLRVLEMTVTLVPDIFLDWSRPSAELLLRRLAQVSLAPPSRRCPGSPGAPVPPTAAQPGFEPSHRREEPV